VSNADDVPYHNDESRVRLLNIKLKIEDACLLTYIYYSIREGGIGDHLTPLSWSDPKYPFRVFFDMSFFVIVITILLNVIFGIIIDTFGGEIMRSSCYQRC